jgi:hypothetical protein
MQERKYAIRMWPKGSHVPQAKDRIHATPLRIMNGNFKGKVVAIDAAKAGDAVSHRSWPFVNC